MTFLPQIEETIDALLTYQTTLNALGEKKSFSIEKESVEKMIESLTAHLRFLMNKEKLTVTATRGPRYRIQSKAHRLHHLRPTKTSPLNLLLLSLQGTQKLRKKRTKRPTAGGAVSR